MPDDPQGVQTPVNDTQEVATPTTEQKTTEETPSGNELPNEASERTKSRFDVLTNQLSEERQRREALERAFKDLQKPNVQQQPNELAPIYDPGTGVLDEAAIADRDRRLQEAEQRALRAEQTVQQYSQSQQERAEEAERVEAFTSHPELDPKSKTFDRNLHNVTKSLMLQSMVHPEEFGDKQLNFKEAGDAAKDMIAKITGTAKQEGAKEAIEQLTPKEQASLDVAGSNNRGDMTDLTNLAERTRRGDFNAISERLRRMKSG